MIAGLTGGMGSGKSTVARLFAVMGCAVFESDQAAKLAYFQNPVRQRIKQLLGDGAYRSDREIDKKYISEKVFADTGLLHQLNSIIHPAVKEMFERFVKEHPRQVIIKESALLFEAGVTGGLDKVIVVAADDETRIARVMQRDGLTRAQIESRLKSQLSQQEKINRADFLVTNNDNDLLIPQTERIFKVLSSK